MASGFLRKLFERLGVLQPLKLYREETFEYKGADDITKRFFCLLPVESAEFARNLRFQKRRSVSGLSGHEFIHFLMYDRNVINISLESFDAQDLKDGQCKYYHENGELKSEGYYKNDQKEGHWVYYHENGDKKEVGAYKAGKRQGEWKSYPINKQKKKHFFIDGIEVSKSEYETRSALTIIENIPGLTHLEDTGAPEPS